MFIPRHLALAALLLLAACEYERVDWVCSCASTHEFDAEIDGVESWAVCADDADITANLAAAADECVLNAQTNAPTGDTFCDCRCDTEEKKCPKRHSETDQ